MRVSDCLSSSVRITKSENNPPAGTHAITLQSMRPSSIFNTTPSSLPSWVRVQSRLYCYHRFPASHAVLAVRCRLGPSLSPATACPPRRCYQYASLTRRRSCSTKSDSLWSLSSSRSGARWPASTAEPTLFSLLFSRTGPRRDDSLMTTSASRACFFSTSGSKVRGSLAIDARGESGFVPDGGGPTTIYALSTAPGRAAIAIVRLSGPYCKAVYRALCPTVPLPPPRRASLRTLHSPTSPHTTLDSALVLYFPSPSTFTGQDMLELHIHGGRAVTSSVLSALSSLRYTRPADPGEFTRLAFYAARLSLPEIESLSALLSAETAQSLSAAGTPTSSSSLTSRLSAWHDQLLSARGALEALIDFSEDHSLTEPILPGITSQIAHLHSLIELYITNSQRGELLRSGLTLALLGAPNAGKSSLLNRLVQRDAAIVSPAPGTTRDVLELALDVGGFVVRVKDTAGLRALGSGSVDDEGGVEAEGMRRARRAVADAHVVVLVVDGSNYDDSDGEFLGGEEEAVLATAREKLASGRLLVAVNKADLYLRGGKRDYSSSGTRRRSSSVDKNADDDDDDDTTSGGVTAAVEVPERIRRVLGAALPGLTPADVFPVSCLSSSSDAEAPGPEEFRDEGGHDVLFQRFVDRGLVSAFGELTSPIRAEEGEEEINVAEAIGASARVAALLEECRGHLGEFLALVEGSSQEGGGEEEVVVVAAEVLRHAAECLARATGKGLLENGGDVEEVLGVVFEKFCVGK